KNFDNSLLATLRTDISPRITNELKVQHLYVYQNSTQGDQIGKNYIPRAIVENIVSDINGTNLATNIQLGGHRFAQESFKNNVFHLTNNLYYDTDWAKYTFGADLMTTTSKSIYGSEVNGRFHIRDGGGADDLTNFKNKVAYRYYRVVSFIYYMSVVGTFWNLAVYG